MYTRKSSRGASQSSAMSVVLVTMEHIPASAAAEFVGSIAAPQGVVPSWP